MDISLSRTSISNENCGATAPITVSLTNKGSACGVLCWWWTSDDTTPKKGTSSCLSPNGGTGSFTANVKMPSSGSSSPTLTVACRNYCNWCGWVWASDSCQNTFEWSSDYCEGYPKSSKPSGPGCYINGPIDDDCLYQQTLSLSCQPLSFSVSSSKSSISLYCGKSESFTVTVQNSDTRTLSCTYSASGGGLSASGDIGSISPGSSKDFSLTVTAPTSCTSTQFTYTVSVICSDTVSGLSSSKTTSVSVSFQPDPCVAALADARSAISDAQTAITNAQSKIKEASDLGADITSAQASLNQANSYLSTAQTTLSTAQKTCDVGDTTNGVNQANSAKNSATQAKSYATDALNTAQKAVTEYKQKQTDAYNKISDANSAIDNAAIMVKNAEDILNNATALSTVIPEALGGLDLVAHKSNINTARAKIDQSKNYVKDAQTAYDQKNFDLAKSKATTASSLANEANSLATDSYTKINAVMMTLGEAAKAIMSASTEISQTDEILTKMNYVIKSVEKWGVNLAEAKDITSTGQTNIDQAKDLLSQAKNRLQAGVSTEAVNKAIEARDKAAEPANRLNRIVSSMSTQTQDALEKAYSDVSSKVNAAEANVKDAAGTYMATQSEITAAQNDLVAAKSQLANASAAINEVKVATDLTTFLGKASLAFSALDEVQNKVNSANAHANAAKMGMYITTGAIGASIAGAAGGGFLFWRRRKAALAGKPKIKKHELEKKKPEKIKEEKPEGKFCKNCGTKIEKGVKFCPECGKKV
jgi:hypothetical protein